MRTPFDLTIDHGGDQFAVTGDRPRLSWKLPFDASADSVHELEALVDGESAQSGACDQIAPVRRVAMGAAAQRPARDLARANEVVC